MNQVKQGPEQSFYSLFNTPLMSHQAVIVLREHTMRKASLGCVDANAVVRQFEQVSKSPKLAELLKEIEESS